MAVHLLEMLHLTECRSLVELVENVAWSVPKLKRLVMATCESFSGANLETLNVVLCRSLSELPASFGGLRIVKALNMDGTGVEDLPAPSGCYRR